MSAPRWAVALLRRVTPPQWREDVLGDLEESHVRRLRRRGGLSASVGTGLEALDLAFAITRLGWERPAGRRGGSMRFFDGWTRDVRHAARNLVRAPGFTLITVATLALAIGANTAIFSVIETVLLDPLAFPEPDRLVSIRGTAPGTDLPEEFGVGTEFYVQYRENAAALEDLGLYQMIQATMRTESQVERLFMSPASPSLFSTLRVTPVIGRLPTEDDPEGTVAVISHALWTNWFARDPAVLGRAYEIAGEMRTVIGVMGPDFRFPEEQTSIWIHDLPTEPIQPGGFGINLVGRLAPGADHTTLTTQLAAQAQRLPERFGGSPAYARIIESHRPVVRSLEEALIGDVKGPLWVLLGTVGIVLLIACANVANLLMVRAESRRRDLAVRRALGAGRAGLIRSQLTEALLLAVIGGVGGVALAWAGVPLLVRAAPDSIPRLTSVALDPTALLFTAAIIILAAAACGLLPAIRFSHPALMAGLRESGRVGAGPEQVTRNALVVVQTAAALVLLVASGLLVQSFRALSNVDAGFDTEDIFTFQMAPDAEEHGLSDGPTFAQFHYTFMDRLLALPGVESVGLVNTLPLDEGAGLMRFATDVTAADPDAQPLLHFTFTGGNYFRTMGIALQAGTYFERNANPASDVKAIVSRGAADVLWPGENPIGKRVRPEADTAIWATVIGVVEDVMLEDLRQDAADPMVYLPMVGPTARSWGVGTPAYVMRTERAEAIAAEVRELIREVAPSAPMYRVSTMDSLADRSMAQLSFTMLTIAVAAGLALLLGAVGLYGVLSYVVTQRTREIGVRMALGARASEVRRMVVAQGGRVTLLGVGVGVLAALLMTRVLEGLLFGVRPIDVPTFTAMAMLMVGVALLASYIPARRASAVDPMRSLRVD